MAIRNLLVAYNGLPASDAALAGALLLREQFDAHLTGLFAHGGAALASQLKPWMPSGVKDALMEFERTSGTEVKASFDKACAGVPLDRIHWIESDARAHGAVAAHARVFDLTVLGLHERAEGYGRSHIELFPDRIAVDSGRPVIIFPPGEPASIVNGRAVVAWDGGRAAARALADAMLLLETEQEVEIVSVGRPPLTGSVPGLDVRTLLERHGVKVSLTELARTRKSIAEVLATHCETTGASLLVMGAYQHSPFREDLFGGVTHDVALHAKIPVLMSH